MIKIRQLDDGFFDELVGHAFVRAYANTLAIGYVAALNLTPATVAHAEVLNVDLVLTEFPPILSGRFEFDYSNVSKRLARRHGFGIGEFEHLHLRADRDSTNFLLQNFGKKVCIEGDEIAIQMDGKSWFWQTQQALELLAVPHDNDLCETVRRESYSAVLNRERACHSISILVVSNGNDIRCGSGMGGHFAAAAMGVSGYGGQIAKNSIEKARAGAKNSDAGRNREAAERLDMQNRVDNLRNQRKK